MTICNAFLNVLFFPGNLVLRKLGITIEQDGGILRSFINSSVWGAICLIIALKYFN